MRSKLNRFLCFLALALPASAQLDSAQLRVKFGAPSALQIQRGKRREIFRVPPGFDLVVDYGAGNRVCKLQVPALMPTDAKVQNADDINQKMHAFLAELVPDSMRGKETGRSGGRFLADLVPDSMRGKELGRGQGASGPFYTVSSVTYEQVTITEARASLATNYGNYPYGNIVSGSNAITVQFKNVACQQTAQIAR
jgi:hypothetical protein